MILIVDANREGVEGLCRLLCGHGVACTTAESGEEALAFIEAQPSTGPFLIMLDAAPSAERAANAIRAILKGHNKSDVCVVMHGPPPDAKERDKAMKLGAIGWLVKSQGCRECSGDNVDRILRWYSNIGGTHRRTVR